MKYIVTGGAGFIGSHIADRLLSDGHEVHIIDNLLTGRQENLDFLFERHADRVVFHELSITDLEGMKPIFTDVDTVFHHAALASVPYSVAHPLEAHEVCVTGTLNVLIAARDAGVRRVVYAASSAAYGDIEGESKTEAMVPEPISPYGAAKLAGETYCQVFSEVYGLETVCLRYFNVFGARQDPMSQYAAVIPLFITAMLKGKAPTIFGDGLQSRDFTYVDNIVHANLLASQSPDAAGQVMNMATGESVNLLQLVDAINTVLGTALEPIHAPPRDGDIKHSKADISRARDLLDFAPIVDFATGLAHTIAYYRDIDGA